MSGLREYASKTGAWHEKLSPELVAEILEGSRNGVGRDTIARWLRDEHGIADATRSKVATLLDLHRG